MNNKLAQFCRAFVRQSAMPKNQLSEMAELCETEVRGKTSLHTLFADYSQTDVCLLYHRNIITTISNTRYSLTSLDA